jgi:opacity protein-like surface antigen
MKKIAVSSALLFFCFGISGTLAQERIRFESDYPKSSTIGLLAGFFFMQDETLQEIYGKSAFFFGGEYTLRFPVKEQHGFDVAAGLRQLKKSGKTSSTEEDTHVRLTSLSLSLRYSLEYEKFTFFVGPGFDYVMYKENYAETFSINAVDGSATGYHITGGGYYNVLPSLAVKAYFKYCAADTEPDGFRVNLGGTEWGLGLVYRFEF